MNRDIKIVIAGEQTLQIDFKNEISVETSAYAAQVREELEQAKIPGVIETFLVYHSLIINYRPEIIRYEDLRKKVEMLLNRSVFQYEKPKRVYVTEIPVLYGGEWGPDLEEVAKKEEITTEEVIRLHSTNPNYLYFIGFSPGLPYLGNPQKTFSVSRRPAPRVKLPRGSVTIWQEQTTIFPVDQPGGWNVIGRTPLRLFDLERDPIFLLKAGQWVQFRPVDRAEYDAIDQEIEAGTYQVNMYWKEQL